MNHSKINDPRFWARWRQAGAVPNPHRFGLSVSLCISRVIRGEVPEKDLHTIVAGTACATSESWDEVIARYRETYWRGNPDEGERIIRRLLAKGRIIQPRLTMGRNVMLAGKAGLEIWASTIGEAMSHLESREHYI